MLQSLRRGSTDVVAERECEGLDRDLVAAAVEGSPQASAVPTAKEIDRWIAALDEYDKVALLSRVARGDRAWAPG